MSDSPQVKDEPYQDEEEQKSKQGGEKDNDGQEENQSIKSDKLEKNSFENSSEKENEDEYNSEEDSEEEEEEEEEEEDEEREESSYSKKKKKHKKDFLGKKRDKNREKRKKRKRGIHDFIDDEADEDDEEEISEQGEITAKERDQYFNEYNKPRVNTVKVDDHNEDAIIERFEGVNEGEEIDAKDEVDKNAFQPSISDPKLWLIKCRLGKERECVENIFHKYFYYNKPGQPKKIKIFSAASFDSLKGYIYVEAFKEANVREAIIGISSLRENSIKVVPLNEMAQIFSFDKLTKTEIRKGQWVRIKNGLYEGDLAQVLKVDDPINKIYIKLIPRLTENNEETGKKESIGEYNKKIKKNIRPRQKLFNPEHYSNIETRELFNLTVSVWNKQTFHDGFLIKPVKIRSLIVEDVVPSIEELKVFDLSRFSKDSEDVDFLANEVEETQISRKKKFFKGDRVKIVQGDLSGIVGKVKSHEDKVVEITVNVEGLDDVLEFPEDYLVKEFLPGEIVQVISGPNAGRRGCVVKIEENTAIIFSESTKSHFKASCEDLVTTTQMVPQAENNSLFKIGELVKISNFGSICYVLSATKYTLKVIDTRNEVRDVSIRDVFKVSTHKINGIDAKKNPITKDDTIKVINGPYKGKKAVIKNIWKHFVFLHSNDFFQKNGIFVDICDNIEILGSELLIDSENFRGKVNKRFIPESIKSLIGKTVVIISGVWKGYNGIVKDVTDKMAYVELSSKPKTIRIDLSCIQDSANVEDNNGYGFKYDTGTPRANALPKTPAYYPQSPGWNHTPTPNYTG